MRESDWTSRSIVRITILCVPIYEFHCDRCDHRFEEVVKAGTDSFLCPACGRERAERILSPPAATPKFVKSVAQNRRLEDKRGTNRGGALQRFKDSRRQERKKS